jgi:dihydroorotate dehydrogenase electron transfer subunit
MDRGDRRDEGGAGHKVGAARAPPLCALAARAAPVRERTLGPRILAGMLRDVAAEVLANRPLSAGYHVLSLAAPAVADATAPGQFVMLKANRGHDPLLRRPFSVFEILRDRDGTATGLTILSKRIGAATALLYDAGPGDHIACLGPLGRPWPVVDAGSSLDACLVAGGVGLAAFATLAEALVARGVRTTLFYGARTGGELFHLDFFRGLGVSLQLTTEDGSIGERGRVTAPLERFLANRRSAAAVYACGPEPMMAAASRIAMQSQCPCHVSLERIMGCGLGGCYSCVVPVRSDTGRFHHLRSCLAGPVMAGDRILWDSESQH